MRYSESKSLPERLLKVKASLFDIRGLFRLDAIMTNILAIALCAILALLLQIDWLLPHPAKYHHAFMVILELLAGIQVIKSAKKSLIMPLLCLAIGLGGLMIQHYGIGSIGISINLLYSLMFLGVVSGGIAVLFIS